MVIKWILTHDHMVSLKKLTEMIIQEKYKTYPTCVLRDTSKKVFLIQRFKYDAIGTEFNTAPRITLTETDAWNWVEADIYSHFDAYDLKIEEYNPCRYSIKISHPLEEIHSIRVCILDQTIRYTIQEIEPLEDVDRYIYKD